MTPKTTSPTPNHCIGDKSEIMKKSLFLLWFKHIQPLHAGIISIPGSPKRWTWKLSPTLTSQITENHTIVTKVGPRRLPKCTMKSIQIDIWPSVCPLGAPLDPMITKMVPQVPKIQPEDLQNDNLRYKKKIISVANQPAAPCIQGGRPQGRSLKYSAHSSQRGCRP